MISDAEKLFDEEDSERHEETIQESEQNTTIMAIPSSNSERVMIKDLKTHSTKISSTDKKIWAKVTKIEGLNALSSPSIRGLVFSAILADESAIIKSVAFCEHAQAVTDKLQLNQQYEISDFNLRPSNPIYNNTGHPVEIVLLRTSKIVLKTEPKIDEFKETIKFTEFTKLEHLPENQYINVTGKVVNIFAITTGTTKTGKPYQFQIVEIKDDEDHALDVKFWNTDCEKVKDGWKCKRIELIKCKSSTYNGVATINPAGADITINGHAI